MKPAVRRLGRYPAGHGLHGELCRVVCRMCLVLVNVEVERLARIVHQVHSLHCLMTGYQGHGACRNTDKKSETQILYSLLKNFRRIAQYFLLSSRINIYLQVYDYKTCMYRKIE